MTGDSTQHASGRTSVVMLRARHKPDPVISEPSAAPLLNEGVPEVMAPAEPLVAKERPTLTETVGPKHYRSRLLTSVAIGMVAVGVAGAGYMLWDHHGDPVPIGLDRPSVTGAAVTPVAIGLVPPVGLDTKPNVATHPTGGASQTQADTVHQHPASVVEPAPSSVPAPARDDTDDAFAGPGTSAPPQSSPVAPVAQNPVSPDPTTPTATVAPVPKPVAVVGALASPPPQGGGGDAPAAPAGDVALELELSRQIHALTLRVTEIDKAITENKSDVDGRIAGIAGKVSGRIDELEHRQDLEEERSRHIQESAKADAPTAAANDVTAQQHRRARPTVVGDGGNIAPQPPHTVHRPHYMVQAGAPDMAILTDDAGNPIRATPGTDLGAWGHVVSVTQAGAGWQVRTDQGVIR